MYIFIIIFFMSFLSINALEPINEIYFYNNYHLGQNAANIPGGAISIENKYNEFIELELPKQRLLGNLATDKRQIKISKGMIKDEFSLEFWIMNHVNRPIGFSASLRTDKEPFKIPLLFGIYANELIIKYDNNFLLKKINLDSVAKNYGKKRIRDYAYKERHFRIVANYSNKKLEILVNNHKITEESIDLTNILQETNIVELSTYLENEPFMKLPNLIRYFAIYNQTLTENDNYIKLKQFEEMIDKGILHPDKFHFNAGPILTLVDKTSISINWETSKEAKYILYYDTTAKLNNKIEIENRKSDSKIANYKLENLTPETNYFYQIIAIDGKDTIKSGILTFSTAVNDSTPFSFALIADTEARPFINDRLAQLIWGERPNFVVIAGDLTDGGFEQNKFEWNYEYFVGLTQLLSRIPVFPILGNGEADKFWYIPYHNLYGKEDFYSVKYGNSEFFFLNSNLKDEFTEGKRIFNWLENSLNNSKATWKFVIMHHAPYSSDEDDYGNTWLGSSTNGDLKIRKITNLFDKYNVDFVFYGHLHCYEKSYRVRNNKYDKDGVYYVLAGGGGGDLEDFSPFPNYFNQKKFRGHHYIKIDISDKKLLYYVYDINNNLIDYMEINK